MAPFNPRISPTGDPSYLHLAKSITQPQPDLGRAIAIKTIGNVVTKGAEAAEGVLEMSAEDKAREGADKIQEDETATLAPQSVKALGLGARGTTNAGPRPQGPMRSGDTLDLANIAQGDSDDEEEAPGAVQDGVRQAGNIEGARANGKSSQTYYLARLAMLQKQLRSQYPGQREYVDKGLAQVTGVNPSVALLASMRADINAASGGGQSLDKRGWAVLKSHEGDEGQPAMAEMWARGATMDNFLKLNNWAAGHAKAKADIDRTMADFSLEEKGVQVGERRASQVAQIYLDNNLNSFMKSKILLSGKDITDPKVAQEMYQQAETGQGAGDEQWEAAARSAAKAKDDALIGVRAELTRPRQELGGRSMATWAGGLQKLEPEIKARIDGQWDPLIASLGSKDHGMAFANFRLNKAMTEDTTHKIFGDKQIGEVMRQVQAVSNINPQWASTLIKNWLVDDKMDKSIKDRLFLLQLDAITGKSNQGLNGDLDKASGLPKEAGQGQFVDGLVRNIEQIKNPQIDDESAKNTIKYGFGNPDAWQAINKLDMDYRDQRGYHQGREGVFNRLTTPDFVSAVVKRSGGDTNLVGGYTKWATNSYQQAILKPSLDNLRDMAVPQGASLYYDSEKHQYGVRIGTDMNVLEEKPGGSIARQQGGIPPAFKDNLRRINDGLASYKNVLDINKASPEGALMGFLKDYGLNQGMVKDLYEAVKTSGSPPKPQPGAK